MQSLLTIGSLLIVALTSACVKESSCPDHAPACGFIATPDECTRNGEPIPCPDQASSLEGAACWEDDQGVGHCDLNELPVQ